MATKVNINGTLVSRPGVYTLVKSGIKNVSPQLPAGNVTIIDDGIGAGYGGGNGGQVYEFDNVQDYQNFVKGGPLWNLGAPLFKPVRGFNGVTKLFLIHARTSESATITFSINSNQTATFVTKDKGLNANGVVDAVPELRKGYAAKLTQLNAPTTVPTITTTTPTAASAGVAEIKKFIASNVHVGDKFTYAIGANSVTFTATTTVPGDVHAGLMALINGNTALAAIVTASNNAGLVTTATAPNAASTGTVNTAAAAGQFVFTFYHGSFKGTDDLNNTPFDGITELNAEPVIVAQSPVVSSLDDLKAWALKSAALNAGFTFTIGTGPITATDVTNNSGYKLATGGTENYTDAAWSAAKTAAKTLDNNFFLAMKSGNDDVRHQHNLDILSDLIEGGGCKYERFLVVGGGSLAADFDAVSKPAAIQYNSDKVILVHGDGRVAVRNSFKRVSSLYKAANVLGRLAGVEVQTPLTFKQIGIDGDWESLTDAQLEASLEYGVLVSYNDSELGYTVVLQDVNTLQNNEFLVNEDASSFNIAVKRIVAQLNKELAISLKRKFLGNQNAGPNRNTVSSEDVTAAVQGFLQSRIASSIDDNYILRFGNIQTNVQQDNFFVSYEFVPNFEISKIIVTGILLES